MADKHWSLSNEHDICVQLERRSDRGHREWSWINKSEIPLLMVHQEFCKRSNFVCNKKANPYLGTLF